MVKSFGIVDRLKENAMSDASEPQQMSEVSENSSERSQPGNHAQQDWKTYTS